jgi:hypothetical protein
LLDNDSQQHKTVSQSSWHNYGVQTGELIRNEVVISNAALIAEILRIWACVDSPDRDDEPKAISGSNFANNPCVHERDVVLGSHERRIGFCYGFVTGVHGPSTGSTGFARKDIFTKTMDYLWRKVVKAPPVTPAARGSHLAVRRVGKKAARAVAANKGDRKSTVLPLATPKAAAPGTEIQVMWWPDADVIVAAPR